MSEQAARAVLRSLPKMPASPPSAPPCREERWWRRLPGSLPLPVYLRRISAETTHRRIDKVTDIRYNRVRELRTDSDVISGSRQVGLPQSKSVDPVDPAARLAVSNLIDMCS